MMSMVSGISAKSALYQLRPQNEPGANAGFGKVLGGAVKRGVAPQAMFSVSNALKSESSVFSALNESLGRARGVVAAAKVGAATIDNVLDQVDRVVGAVEAGAPGGAFKGSLDRLQQAAAVAVKGAQFGGTNLLEEGSTLSVTLGLGGNGKAYDFRQMNFVAVGLSPTDAAKAATTTVSETVVETVEVEITRRDRLTERAERLGQRLERLDAREERLNSRLGELAERQARQEARLERLERQEAKREQRLVDVGARPTDERDQRMLDLARRFAGFADRLEERGSTRLAGFVDAVAERTAERAGLTVSLDRLERMETRLEKTRERLAKTNERIGRIAERTDIVSGRLGQVAERREEINERLESVNNRLATLSEERLNQVVGSRTETVERVVTREIESPTAGSFFDIVGAVGERLKAGDTEGARALINEARARVGRVEEQLGQISGALSRRGGFFGALTDRLDSTIMTKVEDKLSDDDAAAKAAAMLTEIARSGRLFGGETPRPGVLELFAEKKAEVAKEQQDA